MIVNSSPSISLFCHYHHILLFVTVWQRLLEISRYLISFSIVLLIQVSFIYRLEKYEEDNQRNSIESATNCQLSPHCMKQYTMNNNKCLRIKVSNKFPPLR